jgi:TonB family protein
MVIKLKDIQLITLGSLFFILSKLFSSQENLELIIEKPEIQVNKIDNEDLFNNVEKTFEIRKERARELERLKEFNGLTVRPDFLPDSLLGGHTKTLEPLEHDDRFEEAKKEIIRENRLLNLKNKIGFLLSELDKKPLPRRQLPPRYPAKAKANGIEGFVLAEFIVDQNGDVESVAVKDSSHSFFEAPTVDAIRNWVFTPGEKDGRKVRTRMWVKIPFLLQ